MLSIIIPTLNEAQSLPATAVHTRSAANGAAVEIIVSDCGSSDDTASLARDLGLHVVVGGDCRAAAQNFGARAASGSVLLFLHADTLLPRDFPRLISRALDRPGVVGGAFDFEFDDYPQAEALDAQCLRWVVLVNRIRYRWTGNFYGDQSIFVCRDVFRRLGGFPNVRLMEDIGFSRRLRGVGRTAIIRPPVRTSPRRFLSHGVIRQFVQDLTLLGCDSIGICPVRLWERYNNWNKHGPGGDSKRSGMTASCGKSVRSLALDHGES